MVIDPAAEMDSYDEILKQHNATLTTILCTHGHYDHVGDRGYAESRVERHPLL